jgi:hypothetical protein
MSTLTSAPNLTQRPPRSPRVRLGGYVLLPRVIDKGRASLGGKLGEFRFDGTGIDRHFYNFAGIDFEAFKAELAKGGGDSEILAWVSVNAKHSRQPWEIAAWSNYQEGRSADSDAETLAFFATAVSKFTTTREDILTWFDLLDLDDHCTFGGKS